MYTLLIVVCLGLVIAGLLVWESITTARETPKIPTMILRIFWYGVVGVVMGFFAGLLTMYFVSICYPHRTETKKDPPVGVVASEQPCVIISKPTTSGDGWNIALQTEIEGGGSRWEDLDPDKLKIYNDADDKPYLIKIYQREVSLMSSEQLWGMPDERWKLQVVELHQRPDQLNIALVP